MSLFVTSYGDCNNTGDSVNAMLSIGFRQWCNFCNFTADHSKFGSNNQDVVEVQLQEQLHHFFWMTAKGLHFNPNCLNVQKPTMKVFVPGT